MRRKTYQKLLTLAGVALLAGLFSDCAYFNTFYNAQQYFEQAEKLRLESVGENTPPKAVDAYAKVIEKCEKILEKYPDSKFSAAALLLMGKARYYRGEYRLAETVFHQFQETYPEEISYQIDYWLALCKWKLGKPQPALVDLTDLSKQDLPASLLATIYQSIAEIQLEMGLPKDALANLDASAAITRSREQRSQIYYRMAQLAFEQKNYDLAIKTYGYLIKNSTSKKRIEEANLQIVRLHRLKGDWKTAAKKIRSMLQDETYSNIYGSLEIELVKLYQAQDQIDKALTRLESITQDYPRTEISAEAYYLRGEITLSEKWDLEQALKYFREVIRESRRSPFKDAANRRIKVIEAYQKAQQELQITRDMFSAMKVPSDTSTRDTVTVESTIDTLRFRTTMAKDLYQLGELEAFHFNRPDSAQLYFQEIINRFPESDLRPKAMFTYAYLKELGGDTLTATQLRTEILEQYPRSEMADYIRTSIGLRLPQGSLQELFRQNETLFLIQPQEALAGMKRILQLDARSEVAAQAAYFLAHHYDVDFNQADSALKYYRWLQDYQPESEQALVSAPRLQLLTTILTPAQPDTTTEEYGN